MHILFTVILVSLASRVASIGCLSKAGTPVDWWNGYKMGNDPNMDLANPGYTMAYWDQQQGSWWSWEEIAANATELEMSTALYQTTMQLPYYSSPDDASLSSSVGYIVYNDQWCQCPPDTPCFEHKMRDGSVCPTAYNVTSLDSPTYTKCSCNYMGYPTPKDSAGKPFGHAKGFLVFDSTGGFWVSHSVPGFPLSRSVHARAGWSWYKLGPGQHFSCVSLTPAGVEEVARHLANSYVLPQDDSHHVPASLQSQYPHAAILSPAGGYGEGYLAVSGQLTTSLATRGGATLRVFSKEGSESVQSDLWEDQVAPGLASDLFVETWCTCSFDDREAQEKLCRSAECEEAGGCICDAKNQEDEERDRPYCCMKSKCGGEEQQQTAQQQTARQQKVQQVTLMDFSDYYEQSSRRQIKSIQTHAKWAMSQDPAEPWVCFGDINRQPSQRLRGGGALCMKDQASHKIMAKFVKEVDQCSN
jgi:hypothetical protein